MIELLEFTTLLISIHNTKLAEATASLHALHHASVQTKEGISPSALQCKQQALFDNWHTIDMMCSHCWSIVVSSRKVVSYLCTRELHSTFYGCGTDGMKICSMCACACEMQPKQISEIKES